MNYSSIQLSWTMMGHLLTKVLFDLFPKIDIPRSGVDPDGFWVEIFDMDHLAQDQIRLIEKMLQESLSEESSVIDMSFKGLSQMYRSQGRRLRLQQLEKSGEWITVVHRGAFAEDTKLTSAVQVNRLCHLSVWKVESISRKENGKLFKGLRLKGAAFAGSTELKRFVGICLQKPFESTFLKDGFLTDASMRLYGKLYQEWSLLLEKHQLLQIDPTRPFESGCSWFYPLKHDPICPLGEGTCKDKIIVSLKDEKTFVEDALLIAKKFFPSETLLQREGAIFFKDRFGWEHQLSGFSLERGLIKGSVVESFYRWAALYEPASNS